jgi:ATP-binding cassette subfamily B protein
MEAGTPLPQEEEAVQKKLDWDLLRRLLGYLRPYRGRVALSVLLLVLLSGLELLGPYITKIAIDRAIAAEGVPDAERFRILASMGLLFLGVLAAEFTLRYVQVWFTQLIGQRVQYDLRMEIFRRLEAQSLRYFSRNPVGRLLTRVTSDIEALNELFTAGVVEIFGDVFLLAGIATAMLLLDARLALTLFLVLPALFAASLVFRARVRDAFRDVRTRVATMNAYLQESLVGMQVIQLFGGEKRSYDRFDGLNRDHLDAQIRTVFYHAVFFPVVEILGAVAVALLVWKGGASVLQGTITFGALAAFLQYTAQFFRPIRDLSEKYNILQAAMASSERIFELLDSEPEVRAPRNPARPGPMREGIRFESVTFAYDGEEWVLRDIDLEVRKGERVALVGATGSGKSTLVTLLGRFYDVNRGAIRIDGVDLREMDPADLRRRIGTVLQDVFLFSGTVDRNIRLGETSIPVEKMREAAAVANASRFIDRLEGGYDHVLHERGAGLSAGERQLLAFARALAADPEIFVLDEATSNIDSETEALIQEALERILAGRTSLVVAHRLSTIRNADRIVVLHRGRIREEGTHEELLARDGIYKTLYDLEYRNGGPSDGGPKNPLPTPPADA